MTTTNQNRQAVTFGDLIASGYRTCGKRRTCGVIRLAAQAGLIAFHEPGHFMSPPGERDAGRDVLFRFI